MLIANGIENKIPCVTNLVSTTSLGAKATRIENKIPDTTTLAIKVAFKGTLCKSTSFF